MVHSSWVGARHRTNAGGRGVVLCLPQLWVSPLQDALAICLPLFRTGGKAAPQALQAHQEQPAGQVSGKALGRAPYGPSLGLAGVFLDLGVGEHLELKGPLI